MMCVALACLGKHGYPALLVQRHGDVLFFLSVWGIHMVTFFTLTELSTGPDGVPESLTGKASQSGARVLTRCHVHQLIGLASVLEGGGGLQSLKCPLISWGKDCPHTSLQ